MVNKLIQPQEVEVWYIIPLIRKELALAMKKRKMPQNEIASLLGVTDSAISQYSNNKRAAGLKFDLAVQKRIDLSAEKIIEEESEVTSEIQNILKMPEMMKKICQLHKKYSNISRKCSVCLK